MLSRHLFLQLLTVSRAMPDSWAIKQASFPSCRSTACREEPSSRPGGVAGRQSTCDSDGKVDAFIDRRPGRGNDARWHLHPFDTDQYYPLGAFLLGAYQEILGDLHNLFGDTNAASRTCARGPTGRSDSGFRNQGRQPFARC